MQQSELCWWQTDTLTVTGMAVHAMPENALKSDGLVDRICAGNCKPCI